MGERIYLKKKKEDSKFIRFLKEVGADYYEKGEKYGFGIFVMPKKWGKYQMAIKLKEDGNLAFGHIDGSCGNFVQLIGENYYPKEQEWMIEILEKTLKWRGGK